MREYLQVRVQPPAARAPSSETSESASVPYAMLYLPLWFSVVDDFGSNYRIVTYMEYGPTFPMLNDLCDSIRRHNFITWIR
jgi:hypothetical protein